MYLGEKVRILILIKVAQKVSLFCRIVFKMFKACGINVYSFVYIWNVLLFYLQLGFHNNFVYSGAE